MLLKKILMVAMTSSLTLGLIGCGMSNKKNMQPAAYDANEMETTNSFQPAMSNFYGEELSAAEQSNLLNQRVLYFNYDDSQLTQNEERVLKAHAKYLMDNPTINLRISGHTDERGSREYNVALGDRRATSVERFLQTQGIPANRLVVVSFGKEQPAELGSNETAWSKNRRAELDYESN